MVALEDEASAVAVRPPYGPAGTRGPESARTLQIASGVGAADGLPLR